MPPDLLGQAQITAGWTIEGPDRLILHAALTSSTNTAVGQGSMTAMKVVDPCQFHATLATKLEIDSGVRPKHPRWPLV